MNPQEKELLTTLLDRVKNAPRQDKDPEADALIRQAMAAQPDLPYYLTQTVLIQDLSLHQAQQRIADLEKQLADAQQAAKPTVGSFLGGLFGSRPPAQASGPAQAGPQPGPWTRSPQVAAAPPPQPYGQPGYAPQPGYGQQPMGGAMGGGLMGGGMGGAGGGFLRSAARSVPRKTPSKGSAGRSRKHCSRCSHLMGPPCDCSAAKNSSRWAPAASEGRSLTDR